MATRFSPKLRISSALISSAIFMVGCATDATSYNSVRPYYRTQGATEGVSAQAYYEQGKRHFAEKRYGLALNAFQSELSLNSRSINALNGIAACYDKLNRYDLAVSYYYKALQIDPESPRILSNLGYSFLLQGRDAEAIKVLNLALNKDPDNEFIKRNLVLAKSHGWAIDKNTQISENAVAKTKNSPETTKPPASAITTAPKSHIEVKHTSELASNITKSFADKPAENISRSEKAMAKQAAPDANNDSIPANISTVADDDLMPKIEINNTDVTPEKKAKTATLVSNSDSDDSKPVVVSDVKEAESSLANRGTINESAANEMGNNEPETVVVVATAENTISEYVPASADTSADSALMPTIDIVTEDRNETITEIEKDSIISESSPVETVTLADSGLLPAIDIIIEAADKNKAQVQSSEADRLASVDKEPGIATINVDNALAETSVITVEGEKSVSVQSNIEYTIEVSNGNGWNGMARLLGSHLQSKGEQVVRLTNAKTFNYANTVIYYSTGKLAQAQHLASQFPLDVQLEQTAQNRGDIDVRVVLGLDIVAHAPQVRSSLYAWDMNKGLSPVSATVEISNGNGRDGMARLLRSVLVSRGDAIRRVTNADNFNHRQTVIYYSKGRREEAEQLAAKLPLQPMLKESVQNRDDIDLRVVIGKDFLGYEVAMREFMDANA